MAKKSPRGQAPADAAPAQPTDEQESPQLTSSVTPEPAPAAPAVSLDAVLGDAPAMPEVQEHALAAARERKAEAEQANAGVAAPSASGVPVKGKTDERGRPFDKAIHEVGPDGGPIIGSKTGFIRMRRGGAAGGKSASRSKVVVPSPGDSASASLDAARNADVLKEKIASTAAVTAETIFVLGQSVCGSEFAPESSERDGMVAAWTNYYTIRGIVDVPPEVMIAVALGGYVMKRWNMPVFTEKRKGWIKRWRGEKPDASDKPDGAEKA